jgi:feruloyl esterase
MACAALAQRFSHPGTRIAKVEAVAAGVAKPAGIVGEVPEHCLVQGAMDERTGIDGKPYAIGFEMRLPTAWNGRFFYQANGGLDGFVTAAFGDPLGGGAQRNGVMRGFAVISSDAGHALERNVPGIGGGTFGLDPQARLNYGYQAVQRLTPMALAVISTYYGRGADRAYLVGSSNGGRHGFVAAARDSGVYDGILAVTPGWRLPRAALAQVWGAQQLARAARRDPATGRPDMKSALGAAETALVARQVLARCDALDGLADGIVGDMAACQRAFDAQRDLPVCTAGAASGAACLSEAQKAALIAVMAGPRLRDGSALYAPLPWDAGLAGNDWRAWKLEHSVGPRDAVALSYVMMTPPASLAVVTGQGTTLLDFALGLDIDRGWAGVNAKAAPFNESSMEFMTPPDGGRFERFVARGGKLIVGHGVADPVFSVLVTGAWHDALRVAHGAKADAAARLYLVPGMNHSRGGPATDQFDLLDPLVAWVEQGVAPGPITAAARGAGSNLPNAEVPAHWSPRRTRLLCPHPQVGRYKGSGDPESAASFECRAP